MKTMKKPYARLVSLLLTVMMVFSTTVTGFADEAPEEKGEPEAVEKVEEKQEPVKEEPKEEKAEEPKQEEPKKEEPKKEEPKQEQPKPEPVQEEPAAAPEPQPVAEQSAETGADNNASEDQAEASPAAENTAAEATQDASGSRKQLTAELSDGTYKPVATFTGGSGRVTFSCDKVIIKNGEATAIIAVNTDNVTHLYMGVAPKSEENNDLYNPTTGAMGEDVYAFSKRQVAVPVTINEEQVRFSGRTTAMSVNTRWIMSYTYTLTITDESQKISDDTTIPDIKPEDDDKDDDKKDDKKTPDKKKKKKQTKKKALKDGTYKVKATTSRDMFYLYPKEKDPATVILVKKNGKMTATITLTGVGYDYVYMGTPKQAKKAGKKNWIKYKKRGGYYTFKIPVARLDKKLPITPHSSKYESDGDPTTDPWRPDKWIKFYRSGIKKVKSGTSIKTKGKAKDRNGSSKKSKNVKPKNDGKAATQSKYKDDSAKSTSAVNNSTGLKDGVYTPDRFSWSGGSGRLAYIRCNKITVKGGKAIATIEFSSGKYDSLKANGRVYSKSGSGNSIFNIPVKLNANNTIIGRTTAMSQPHWVKYNIYIYKRGAGTSKSGKTTAEGDDGHVTHTKKLSSKAPDLMGLEFKEEVEVEHAKYFKIYKYEQGITLIEVDQASDTALYKNEKKSSKDESKDESSVDDTAADDSQGAVEYDEDGKPIAKSQNEITDELYHNNVVNYLIVPEKVEVPAGLDKDCIVIRKPVEKGYVASHSVIENIDELGVLDAVSIIGMEEDEIRNKNLAKAVEDEKVQAIGDYEKPDYAAIIKGKTDLALFPAKVLPEKVEKKTGKTGKTAAAAVEKAEKEAEEKKEVLETLQKRFSALSVPMLVDRSENEASNYAAAEWIKVYGAIFDKEDQAKTAFEQYMKDNKKEKLKK